MDKAVCLVCFLVILSLDILNVALSRNVQNEVWGDVRLANGGSVYEGRVEVKVNGTWGTVCDDSWSTFDGIVICKQLGFDGLLNTLPGGTFGAGTGPIWHDDLACTSQESSLDDCPGLHDPNMTDCVHAEDAAVRCLPPGPRNTTCRDNQFLCTSEKKCIPARWVCDNQDDCHGNNEDELGLICNKTSNCGIQSVRPLSKRIVGGQDARPGSWPWMVYIKVVLLAEQLCGGTLIAPQWVLTAAHCFDKYNWNFSHVVVGDTNKNITEGSEQEIDIHNVSIHKDYVIGSHSYDIALVQLRHPVSISSQNVNFACLPLYGDSPFTSADTCYVTGWGDTKGTGNNNILQQAQVPILNNTQCSGWYGSDLQVDMDAGILCAGYQFGGIDACQGDSGGPLSCLRDGRWTVAGIVVWGEGCAQMQHPGIYTEVGHFVQWIAETIKAAESQHTGSAIPSAAIVG